MRTVKRSKLLQLIRSSQEQVPHAKLDMYNWKFKKEAKPDDNDYKEILVQIIAEGTAGLPRHLSVLSNVSLLTTLSSFYLGSIAPKRAVLRGEPENKKGYLPMPIVQKILTHNSL